MKLNSSEEFNSLNAILQQIIEKYGINLENNKNNLEIINHKKTNNQNSSFISLISPLLKSFREVISEVNQSDKLKMEIYKKLSENYDLYCIVYLGANPDLFYSINPKFKKLFHKNRSTVMDLVDIYVKKIEKKPPPRTVLASISFFRDDGLKIARLFENIPLKYAINKDSPFLFDKLNNSSKENIIMYINDLLLKMGQLIEDYVKDLLKLILEFKYLEENKLDLLENWRPSIGQIIIALHDKNKYLNLVKIRIYRNSSHHGTKEIRYYKDWKQIKVKIWDDYGNLDLNLEQIFMDFFKLIAFLDTIHIIIATQEFKLENKGKNDMETTYEELKKKFENN